MSSRIKSLSGVGPPSPSGPKRKNRLVRRLAIAIGIPAMGFALLATFIIAFEIKLDLSLIRARVEAIAERTLDRQVEINGSIEFLPALWPTLKVGSVRIGNPSGWPSGDFMNIETARVQLDILSLFRGDVRIREIAVERLKLNLEASASGSENWVLEPTRQDSAKPRTGPELAFLELQELSLSDIAISYRDAARGKAYDLVLDRVTGEAASGQSLLLSLAGSVQDIPLAMTFSASSLASLFDKNEPSQVRFEGKAAQSSLAIAGEIEDALRAEGLALNFKLEGPEMEALGEILGVALPPVRSFALAGHIEDEEGTYRLPDLAGNLGPVLLMGNLEVRTERVRPWVGGEINIRSVDLAPVMQILGAARGLARVEEETRAPESKGASSADLDEQLVTLDGLKSFDAALALNIDEFTGAAISIEDASLEVKIAGGTLTSPIGVTIAEVPFAGEFRLFTENDHTQAALDLAASGGDIGELLALLLPLPDLEGSFAGASLELSGAIDSLGAMLDSADMGFDLDQASLSYGSPGGGRRVDLTIDTLGMRFPLVGESNISARGNLLTAPFTIEVSSGSFIESYTKGQWPLRVTASGAGAKFLLEGSVGEVSVFDFDLSGDRIGDLSPWTGLSSDAEPPYASQGTLAISPTEISIDFRETTIGNSQFSGEVGRHRTEDGSLILVDLHFPLIDGRELATLSGKDEVYETGQADKEALSIDVPILPESINLADSDISLSVDELVTERGRITGVAFAPSIREGFVQQTPFRAAFAGSVLSGSLDADLRGESPAFNLALVSDEMDVGALLDQFGVARGLEIRAGKFDIDLALRGASVRRILELSDFRASLRDGNMKLGHPNIDRQINIEIANGSIEAKSGKPISITLETSLDGIPAQITIESNSLASFAQPHVNLETRLTAEMLNSQLSLVGTAALPLNAESLSLKFDMTGEALNDFAPLTGLSLPPYGPFSIHGLFGVGEFGYNLEDLRLEVGSSSLTGNFKVDVVQYPPHLKLDVAAQSIQLDDFDTGDWSATRSNGREPENAEPEGEPLLSYEALHRFNADLRVNVAEVLSGNDQLGRGTLEANLAAGRFSVDKLLLQVPGGDINVSFAVHPSETEVALSAQANIDNLDYGLLARRIDATSTTGGLISLDLGLETRGKDFFDIMSQSNGHIDFAIWPRDLKAGIFDLWAVNLFTALLPSLDSEASKVNCLVARFSLDDGIMRPEAILADTSRIQASADGVIDFKNDRIELTAVPRPKRPKMFSAQTPIKVQGRLADFTLGLPPGALLGTVLLMIPRTLTVPFQWIFTKNEPPDGKVACQRAWARQSPSGPS